MCQDFYLSSDFKTIHEMGIERKQKIVLILFLARYTLSQIAQHPDLNWQSNRLGYSDYFNKAMGKVIGAFDKKGFDINGKSFAEKCNNLALLYMQHKPELVHPDFFKDLQGTIHPYLGGSSESLDSHFHIEIQSIAPQHYQQILQSNALIRITGAKKIGKTTYLNRFLEYGKKAGGNAITLDFYEAPIEILENIPSLNQWCMERIYQELKKQNLDINITEPKKFSKQSKLEGCTLSSEIFKLYLKELITKINNLPLFLGIDNVDRLFYYPKVAVSFFSLLRAFHDNKCDLELSKLRVILSYTMRPDLLPFPQNESPFNVGFQINLRDFCREEVLTLAERYFLNFYSHPREFSLIIQQLGGHPYLTRLLFDEIYGQREYVIVTKKVLQIGINNPKKSVFAKQLDRLWRIINNDIYIYQTFESIVFEAQPVKLPDDLNNQAYKLEDLGLIKREKNTQKYQIKYGLYKCFCHYYNDQKKIG